VIESPSGSWGPIAWIIAIIVALFLAYFIRSRGEKTHRKGVQSEEFLMANPRLSEEKTHVRAHNIYWGFFEGLKRYYDPAINTHTGITNDYIIWFTAVTAIVAIILSVVGVI
jgi:hypothetical protein